MSKFYFQLEGNIIRDAITYPHDGYSEVELDVTHLPVGINAGYYRLQDGVPVLDQALKEEVEKASRSGVYVDRNNKQENPKQKAKRWLERLTRKNRD